MARKRSRPATLATSSNDGGLTDDCNKFHNEGDELDALEAHMLSLCQKRGVAKTC